MLYDCIIPSGQIPVFKSENGILFDADCMDILPLLGDSIVDMVFADPPFNLNKKYGKNSNDNKTEEVYLAWCKKWIRECVRILKDGGAFFLYNLPKWNIPLGAELIRLGMEFRHWIAIEMAAGLPIANRLYPSHYSLLYYTKGKPKTFRRIRTPIQTCRHCGGEIKDYGGHRKKVNPNGLTLKDVWTDVSAVRHTKFKSKARKANALSTKILDRALEMSTNQGDVVLDPFGGSGTTYAACEKKNRSWIGIEIDFADVIINRIKNNELAHHKNDDYIEEK